MDLFGCYFRYAGISSNAFGKTGPLVKVSLNSYSDIPILDISEQNIQVGDVIRVSSDSAHDYNSTFYEYSDTEPTSEEIYVPAKDEGYWVFMGIAIQPESDPGQYSEPTILEYAGRNLIIASVESSEFTSLQGSTEFQTVFNGLNNSLSIVGEKFNDSALSFDIDVVTDDALPLSDYDIKNIQKWLFSKYNYEKLYSVSEDTTMSNIYLNCRLVEPQKIIANGGIIGFGTTVVTDSGFAWENPTVQILELNIESEDEMATGTIIVDSDMPDYIYPTVTIKIGDVGGTIYISNSTDSISRFTKFDQTSPNSTIIMDGTTNMISDDYYERLSEKNFIRLLDGINSFTVNGNVKSINFTFNNRKFL